MCVRPDVNPSLQCVGKERAIDTAQWVVDQRPFVWTKPAQEPQTLVEPQTQVRPLWTAWKDTFDPEASRPYAGIQTKDGMSDESFEGDSSLSLSYGLRASPTSPLPIDIEVLKSKTTAALKPKLRSGRTSIGKISANSHHKARGCDNRRAASTEICTPVEDVSMSLSVAESEDPIEDEVEGSHGLSEKRRKRMLSNRASAQRSRQRRQQRLDTLEILVAELRVEKAALTRKANKSTTAAKKSEDENKTLRQLLREHDHTPLSGSNASNESDKTSENSIVAVNNQNCPCWKDSSSHIEDTRTDSTLSRAKSGALKIEAGDEPMDNSTPWKRNVSSSNFNFDFNYLELFSGRAPAEMSGSVNIKDVNKPATTGLAKNHLLQSGNSFGNDLEQCYLEMDSSFVEDMWREGLASTL